MTSDDRQDEARTCSDAADRVDELAEVSELMGDEATALRLREAGARYRAEALRLLDE